MRKKEYCSFESARKFVHKLELTSSDDWKTYYKSDKRPDNIPTNPRAVYKEDWKGMGDWLGTGRIATQDRKYTSFTKARKFARKLKLKNADQWKKYAKSGKRPTDIPSHCNEIYKKDWKGWGDFLGTGNIGNSATSKQFLSFKDARAFVRTLHFKSNVGWINYTKSGNKPKNIPAFPAGAYKEEWKGLGDWLGTGTLSPTDISSQFISFELAQKFVRKLKLKNRKEWELYCKSGKKPDNIPFTSITYKRQGTWTSWGDFLGTGNVATSNREYLPFDKVRDFVHGLKLKTKYDWTEYCKSGKKPDNIPTDVQTKYKKEWITWGDFLGTYTISNRERDFVSFNDARKFARKLKLKSDREWMHYCKSGKKPDNIPTTVRSKYKKDWKGWGDFLGTGKLTAKEKHSLFLSPKEAKPVLQKLFKEYDIKNGNEWIKFAKTHGKLLEKLHLPTEPMVVYSLENYKKRWNK